MQQGEIWVQDTFAGLAEPKPNLYTFEEATRERYHGASDLLDWNQRYIANVDCHLWIDRSGSCVQLQCVGRSVAKLSA